MGDGRSRTAARGGARSSSEYGESVAPVEIFDGAFDGEHCGATGKLSPRLIGPGRHYRGLSTADLRAATMVNAAQLL